MKGFPRRGSDRHRELDRLGFSTTSMKGFPRRGSDAGMLSMPIRKSRPPQ